MNNEQQSLDPVAWCQHMIDTAINGDVAYMYHQLKEQWQELLQPVIEPGSVNG